LDGGDSCFAKTFPKKITLFYFIANAVAAVEVSDTTMLTGVTMLATLLLCKRKLNHFGF
jgi:hypothetical protein